MIGVTPVRVDESWLMVDVERRAVPASMSDRAGWLAIAVSGGKPVDLMAGYDGRMLRPLAMIAEGEYVSLAKG